MPASVRADFFLSRRGSVAAVAREVADTLAGKGYTVVVQDYDNPLTANFIEMMHEAVKNSRDLVVLFTSDYETSPYTRKEFTSFEAERLQVGEERRIVILRCEDVPLRGLLAPNVYQDLVGIDDPPERRRRILAAAEGQSQAPRPPLLPFVGAPPRIASFTGRVAEFDRLDAILIGGDKPAAITQLGRAAVQGLGGVGKTALAVEYAHRYRNLYAGVWWCPAETRVGLLTALAGLAVSLGAATADEPDLEKGAKAGLRRLAEQRATWLLIYDNVATPEAIAEFLPASGARVLITSRFADWAGWAEEVSLDVLPPEEAAAFLESRAGREDNVGAAALAAALGCLPLALDHAAAYCKRIGLGFADYGGRAAGLIATAPRGAPYPRSVAITFDLAITAAAANCQAAEAVMAYVAQCAPERVPLTLIEGARDDEGEHTAALLALGEVSLVKHDPFADGTPAITVHRLVQSVARARAKANGTEAEAAARLLATLAAIYPDDGYDNPSSWPLCAQLTPHLLTLRGTAPADAAGWAALLSRAGGYYLGRGDYAQSEPLQREALAIHEEALGPEHPDTARSLNNLADLLQIQGDLTTARPLHERALAIREKAFGPEHPQTAESVGNFAALLRDQGDLAEARPLYERALAINEKVLGPDHLLTAKSLRGLALLLQAQGDLASARSLCERALAINEKALGPEHPQTAATLDSLASLLQDRGDFAAARQLYERALEIHEKALSPEHPHTATSLNNLARLFEAQGDYAAARPLCERALAINEKARGPEHPETATSLNNLAMLLRDQGDFSAAQPLCERALAINEKVFGPEHPETATILNNLAYLFRAQGDLAAARPLCERALQIREKVLGPGHPETATSLNDFARILQDQGDFVAARPLFERTLAISENTLGPEHPWTAASLSNLANLLRDRGEHAAARSLCERALQIREKVLGPGHPETAMSLNNLARILQDQGDFAAAQPLFERALAINEKALDPGHPNTARVRSNYARLLLATGQSAEALRLAETALAAHEKALGTDHPWTRDAARMVADALAALRGSDEEAVRAR